MLEIYGIEHILYLLVSIPCFIGLIYGVKKHVKNEEQLTKVIRYLGIIYGVVLIWNRISVSLFESDWHHFIPDLYCGISGIVLSLCMIFLKKEHAIFHCVIYIGILGGTLTMIYPDFLVNGDSLFFQPTISGLIHHSFLVFMPILLVYMGYVKPDLKKYYILPVGMACYITFGVFEMTVLNYDKAMYLFNPALPNTMFDWFGLALLFLPTHFLFLVVWHYLPQKFKPKSLSASLN